MVTEYLRRIGWKRFLFMFIGNIVMGLGIAFFKLSGMGNDPYTGMNMAISDLLPVSFPVFQICMNVILFGIEFIWGRHYIGIGTVVNALLLGYFTAFFHWMIRLVYIPQNFPTRFAILLIGIVITSLGVSLYQTSDAGIAPYDSLSLIAHARFPRLPYFWARIICDAFFAFICFLAGGIVGLGTLASVCGLGSIIQFFNVHFSEKLLSGELQQAHAIPAQAHR